jgi:hypothetical protein
LGFVNGSLVPRPNGVADELSSRARTYTHTHARGEQEMALKQGRMRESGKKKAASSNPINHWLLTGPTRRNGCPGKNPPKPLPRRFMM